MLLNRAVVFAVPGSPSHSHIYTLGAVTTWGCHLLPPNTDGAAADWGSVSCTRVGSSAIFWPQDTRSTTRADFWPRTFLPVSCQANQPSVLYFNSVCSSDLLLWNPPPPHCPHDVQGDLAESFHQPPAGLAPPPASSLFPGLTLNRWLPSRTDPVLHC